MKFLCKAIGLFVILFSFTAIFTACKSSTDDDPEAQVPRITSISSDVSTVVNIAKEISVGVEISDSGKLSYQWYVSDSKLNKGNPEENGNEAAFTPKTENAGTFYYYCEVKNTLDSSVRSVISPIITYKVSECINAQIPSLVQQPENVTASFGENFSLSTFAYPSDGGNLSYQWFFTTDKDKAATPIQEATNATLTGTVSANSLGYYYCVITNTITDNGDGGKKTADIKTETVSLSSTQIFAKEPVILQQPQNLKLDFGNDFTFSVAAYSADNGSLSYQWYYKSDKNGEAVAVAEATKENYSEKVSAKTIGYYYCLIANTITDNGDGGVKRVSLQTSTVSLSNDTIEANKPVILTQPQDTVLHVPETALLSVSAYSVDKGTLTYQWHKVTGEKDEAIEKTTEASYEVVAAEVETSKYYCVVTNTITDNGDGGLKSASEKTNAATVTVVYTNAEVPVITTQPDDVSAVIPAIKVFQIGAYTEDGGVLTYQWYSVAEGETEGTPITDENKSKLIVNVKELGKTGYYCVVTNTIPDNGDGSGKKQASVKSETAWLDAIYLKEVISAPAFTDQPEKVNIVPYNQSIKLSCTAKAAEGTVSYRWYESTDGTTDKGIAVSNATTSTLTTPKYTERGIYYYYCVATNVLAESEENIKSACAISDVVSVAYTGLPVVIIETVEGEEPTADYVSPPEGGYGAGLKNATKVPSRMKIFKAGQKNCIYDSGDYVKKESGLTIKLRGNTSAYTDKKPYKLKLQKKADLLADLNDRHDDKYKDKEWILLKDGTTLKTFIGLAVADITGTPWTPEFAYVNVVMNGTYRGVYMLIEAITKGKKRIDVSDNGYIIERDAYWWNEDVKFITEDMNQKYTFKYPDDEDISEEQIAFIKKYMNNVETHIKDGTYENYIDTDSFARWQLIHDILGTSDSGGSNIYISKYDNTDDENTKEDGSWSRIMMSTPWDFDSIYNTSSAWSNIHKVTRIYSKPLFESNNTAYKDSYKSQWDNISPVLWNELSSKLIDMHSKIGEDLNLSRMCNAKKWNSNYNLVEADIKTTQIWFTSRTTWLNSAISEL